MKKLLKSLFAIFLCLGLLVGCGNKDVDLDLEKINSELVGMKGDNISIPEISANLEQYFIDAEFIYDYDFEEKFNLNSDNILEYSVMANFETKDMYFVLNPVEGKEDEIKSELKAYFESLMGDDTDDTLKEKIENRLEKEYEGLLIYVVSSNNDEVYNTIIDSKGMLFGMLMNVEGEMLEQVFDITESDLEEYLIAIPAMNVKSNSYIIVKPKKASYDKVKDAMASYMTNLEGQMANYLADQFALIENRLEKEYGGYLIYIISDNNEKVYNTIVNE